MTEPASPSVPDWEWHLCAARREVRALRFSGALKALDMCERLRPGHMPALLLRAGVLFRSGEVEAARLEFERVLSFEPCNVSAHHGAGLALHACGDRAGALAAFRKAVTLDPGAWRSWQSIADITPDEPERRGAIAAVAGTLLGICETGRQPPHILKETARALVSAGRRADALRLLQDQSGTFPDKGLVQGLIAGVHYAFGAFYKAARHQFAALSQTPRLPAAARKPDFEVGGAPDVLRKLFGLFEAGGFHPFLMAGTLLGFLRSGAPLTHDRDIDIGLVRGDGNGADPVEYIRAHPGLILPHSARPGDRYIGLALDGIATDIFVFDRHPDGFVCGFSSLPGDIQWRHAPFELGQRRFGEQVFRIPDPAASYLAECYGPGWQVPDRGFASALSSPALYQTDPHAIAYLALARARTSLLTGDATKAYALLGQIPLQALKPALADELTECFAAHRAAPADEPEG